MKRNTNIIISITGIIIITLMLLVLTYGYFVTQISGNTNEKSIEVTTGDMSILFTDLTEEISDIIQPGYETTKTFTIENTGNVPATYSIFIDVFNNFSRTQDITYTLYRINNDSTFPENYSGCVENPTDELACKIIVNNAQFPTRSSIVKADEMLETPGDVYRYDMVITYINSHENQNEDQGKTFSGKIVIRSTSTLTNPYSEGTLAYSIFSNDLIVKNAGAPTFDGIATEEEGLYSAEDDYGTSWYFRGAQPNNYVNFAGFTWRVVRINGDGSVRLILDGSLNKICVEYDTDGTTCLTYAGSNSAYNSNSDDNAYVGYMYGLSGTTTDAERCIYLLDGTVTDKTFDYTTEVDCVSNGGKWTTTAYEATHANVGSSTIKMQLDSFYQKHLNSYNDYISDTMFCGDKTLAKDGIGDVEEQLGYAKETTYYSATQRLKYFTGTTSITNANPTLKCAENADNTYSRYTVNGMSTNKGIPTNGDLTHPIALISADELVMAGAWGGSGKNTNYFYYLYDANANGLSNTNSATMTPYYHIDSNSYEFVMRTSLRTLFWLTTTSSSFGIRPVINLRADLLVNGSGTSDNPYTVELPS